MTKKQKVRIEKVLNRWINACLWKPSGDPDNPLLKKASVAYWLLKEHQLTIEHEDDVVACLSGGNCEGKDYLKP